MANKTYPELPAITLEDDNDIFPTWTVNAAGVNPEKQTRAQLRASMQQGIGGATTQSAYDASATVLFATATPYLYKIPDTLTPRFLTQNELNGVDGAIINYDLFRGKDQLGFTFAYSQDELLYRQDLTTLNIHSSQRNLAVAQNGILIDYLQLDGGAREIRLNQDSIMFKRLSLQRDDGTTPELFTAKTTNGVNGEIILNFRSDSRTDVGVLKTLTALQLRALDTAPGTFSNEYKTQMWAQNALVDVLFADGTDSTTGPFGILQTRNSTTGLLDYVATVGDIPASSTPSFQNIYDKPSYGFTIGDNNFDIDSEFGAFVTFLNEFGVGQGDSSLLVRGKIFGYHAVDVESVNLSPTFSAYKNNVNPGSSNLVSIEAYANNSIAAKTLFYQHFVRSSDNTSGSEDTLHQINGMINGVPSLFLFQQGDQTLIRNQTSGNAEQVLTTSDVPASIARPVFTLSNGLIPTQNYPTGVWTSVLSTENGSRVIAANSLAIGSSVEITITGLINSILSGGNAALRCMFAGVVMATSRTITVAGPTGLRNWALVYKLTRINATQYNVSASGHYEDYSNNVEEFEIRVGGLPKTGDFTIANLIDVQCLSNTAVGNTFDLIATNFNLIQIT